MKKRFLAWYADGLFRNSLYLLLATGVMAGFGFFFWLLASRIFSPADVGLATTLIAVMNLIAMLSLLGFDTALVRFLPSTTHKDATINTGMLVVAAAAVLIAGVFLALVGVLAPVLLFIRAGVVLPLIFIFLCAATALNILTDSIFLAHRAAKYTFIINTLFSASRIVLLLCFVHSGTVGIFLAVGVSQTIGLVLSVLVLLRSFAYVPAVQIDAQVLRRVGGYSAGNYVAGILNLLPATILPIMIIDTLGPAKAAFFSIAMMIGNLLYAVPWTTTRSLFAEGSRDPETLAANVRKSLKLMAAVMVPAVVVLCVGGGLLLSMFGKAYSVEGFRFLQLVAVTGLAVCALSLLETYFRVVGNSNWLIIINIFYMGTICGLGYVLLPFGLAGIGVAWLAGHVVASVVSYLLLRTCRTTAA